MIHFRPETTSLAVELAMHHALIRALHDIGTAPAHESDEQRQARAIGYERIHAFLLDTCPHAHDAAARANQVGPAGESAN